MNSKIITKDGKKYRLVPIEDGVEAPQGVSKPRKDDILADYQPSPPKGVRKAVGKVSTYREKFKTKSLSLSDLPRTKFNVAKIPMNEDSNLDSQQYKGDKLFFGKGTEQLA